MQQKIRFCAEMTAARPTSRPARLHYARASNFHGVKLSATIILTLSIEGDIMAVSLKSLGIERLGIEERLTLVEELWDSIAADSTALPLTQAQRAELDRRIAEHEANPNDVVPWEEIRTTITERLKK